MLHKNKIIEILATFSKEDVKRFREYLNSPFFNKSEKLIRLYEALIIFHPHFNSRNFTEINIFNNLNPGMKFNISTFRNLLSDLSFAAENYLSIVNFNEKYFEKKDCLRNEQFKRNLSGHLDAGLKKAEYELNNIKNIDAPYFLNKYKLSTDRLNFNLLFKNKTGKDVILENKRNLNEHGKNITCFFANEINRINDNILVMGKTFEIYDDDNFVLNLVSVLNLEKILALLAEGNENESISILFKLLLAKSKAFSNPDNSRFYYDYKKLVLKEVDTLDKDELRYHTIRLLKYCMMKNSQDSGDETEDFRTERFNVYNLILENKYYKCCVSDFIPVELYRTVLLLSLELKKYTWAFNFIKKYKSELPPDRRENLFNFSCAEYYFCRGRYTDAMKSFHKVKFDHFMLKIDMKNLMLRTYYELDLFDNALSLIDTYKHFLSNDKTLSADEKRINKNFINVLQKMILYRASGKKAGKYLIEQELQKDCSHKDWMLEKLSRIDRDYEKSA